jgi:hypothetical protein
MVLHNYICEHSSGDADFANCDRDPNFVLTIPDRYNKYNHSEASFLTMDSFRDSVATSISVAWS